MRKTQYATAPGPRECPAPRLTPYELRVTRPMTRYRITTTRGDAPEQTWVLLPGRAAAVMQAEELANRERSLRVRVYRETTGEEPTLDLDLPPRPGGPGKKPPGD